MVHHDILFFNELSSANMGVIIVQCDYNQVIMKLNEFNADYSSTQNLLLLYLIIGFFVIIFHYFN
jgi:hypothetical protein